jgi:hypothetical protein
VKDQRTIISVAALQCVQFYKSLNTRSLKIIKQELSNQKGINVTIIRSSGYTITEGPHMPQELSIGYRKSLIDLSFYKILGSSGISKSSSLVNRESSES